MPSWSCRLFCVVSVFVMQFTLHWESTTAAEPSNEPLVPEISAASDEPQQAVAGISIPDGWKISVFAAEPDVANVVAFDIDYRGRIFACETFRQNRGVTDNRAHDEQWTLADLASETVQDRIDYHKRLLGDAAATYAQHDDRVRRLVDSNGDGVADQSQVLANGFHRLEEGTGAGIFARGKDVYFTCIPKLWKLTDKDDDGVAEERSVLSDGYGVRVAFRGHDLHGLTMGHDGRLYFSIGDRGYHILTKDGNKLANPAVGAVFRCELDGSNLEVFANGLRNPQELAFNDIGDLFSVDNNSDSGDKARIVHILEGGDTGWRMYYQYLPDRGPFNQERIWEPFHNEQAAYIVPPITNFTDGPSGLAFYPGTGFGDQLKNKFLICDFRGGPSNSGIRSFELEPNGAFYKLKQDAQPIWTCLATDVAFGPDGALYVSDWVDGWDGLGKGRIYRLQDPKHSNSAIVREVQELLESNWNDHEPTALVEQLSHVDRRVRLEAQWELARRESVDALAKVAQSDADDITRLHGIWGLEQIARHNQEKAAEVLKLIRPLHKDSSATIAAAAIKVSGEHVDKASAAAIRELIGHESPRVRYFAAIAASQLKDAAALSSVVAMLARNDNRDPALRHAGVMYLAATKPTSVAALKTHPNVSVRRAAVVGLRRQENSLVAEFLADKDGLVIGEAARAIHDVPIPVGLPPLASLLDKDTADLVVLRRALNANYRLGTQETAQRLAAYAAKSAAPAAMRIEALEMLQQWAKPDPRDRVLNDYRPLEPRDVSDAAKALEPQIDSLMLTDSKVRAKMIDVASTLGIKKITPEMVRRVADDSQPVELRATALSALARLSPSASVKLAKGLAGDADSGLALAALSVLAQHDSKNSIGTFVTASDHQDAVIRQKSWDILGRVANGGNAIAKKTISNAVQRYVSGKLPAPDQLNVLEAATGNLSDELKKQLADFDTALAEKDPLAKWLPSLQGGDVDRGNKLFYGKTELSCVRCHKVDRAGGEVGPNLTTIGKEKDRRYLLEAICLPNAQVAKGFETVSIIDDEDNLFTGIIKEETDDFIEIIESSGTHRKIDQDAIVGRRKGKSSMPEDLTKHMTPRELRDLVAYLASLKVDRRSAEDVE